MFDHDPYYQEICARERLAQARAYAEAQRLLQRAGVRPGPWGRRALYAVGSALVALGRTLERYAGSRPVVCAEPNGGSQ